jgi:hypothetical protein
MILKDEHLEIYLDSVIIFIIFNQYFQYLHECAGINLAQFVGTVVITFIVSLISIFAI